jgi:hypothetical protein
VLYRFLVLTRPVEGHDDAFNEWYTNRHLKELLALPGFISVQRFKMVVGAQLPEGTHPYMAIYEIETDDPASVYAALRKASAEGAVSTSPAYDRPATVRAFYRPITERLVSPRELTGND